VARVNVLTGGSIIAASVLVPCMLGTVVLALLTLEFVTAFPAGGDEPALARRDAGVGRDRRRDRVRDARPEQLDRLDHHLAEVCSTGRRRCWCSCSRDRAAPHPAARRAARDQGPVVRWAFGFVTYTFGPVLGVFESAVWAETTFATMISFVVIGTAVLRGELFSIRSSAPRC